MLRQMSPGRAAFRKARDSLPCQVPQRRMATFAAQPFGPGLFLRDAAFLVAYLERPNFASRALPRAKTGSGANAYETGTDPRRISCLSAAERGRVEPWNELLQAKRLHMQGRKPSGRYCPSVFP
ncbi:hypothetical protein EA795_17210 [Stutzerimonas nitrititolerans]|uniref:Transposase n=1 Tax=Stutzerimonas nitrititolerans TaxID=2482751 RepID=A0ABX9UZ92_9GAMM|nr:hypothetical protein EA795_17210 [Stutzerimonas nitrititolerans]